jgi:predicted RNA-binding Zn-ribbon protein involved in translation (DUF1610 family)
MTDFTNLRESIATFTDAITSIYAGLLHDANGQREEFIDLCTRMDETRSDILEYGKMLGDLAVVLDETNDKCQDIATKITTAIYEGVDAAPSVPYEEFVDFCDNCGSEILVGDEYTVTGGNWYTCPTCVQLEKEAELAETANGETPDEE